MQKEELKNYLLAAIDALSDEELDYFMVPDNEPDLFMVAGEISSLAGEVRKMNTLSLKLSNSVQSILDTTSQNDDKKIVDNREVTDIIEKIVALDEIIERTNHHFKLLPTPAMFTLSTWLKKFSAWKEGYEIMNEKWVQLKKSLGITLTGKKGETFNPQYHEAVSLEQIPGINPNIIVECIEPGYTYKGIIIKLAKVIVNK